MLASHVATDAHTGYIHLSILCSCATGYTAEHGIVTKGTLHVAADSPTPGFTWQRTVAIGKQGKVEMLSCRRLKQSERILFVEVQKAKNPEVQA
jgi:hypothetical protein